MLTITPTDPLKNGQGRELVYPGTEGVGMKRNNLEVNGEVAGGRTTGRDGTRGKQE